MLKINPSQRLTTKPSAGKSGMGKLPIGPNATGKSTTAPAGDAASGIFTEEFSKIVAGDKQDQRESMLRWFD